MLGANCWEIPPFPFSLFHKFPTTDYVNQHIYLFPVFTLLAFQTLFTVKRMSDNDMAYSETRLSEYHLANLTVSKAWLNNNGIGLRSPSRMAS